VFFLRRALVALPDIVSTSIPVVVQFADKHGIDLPFNDMESLKDMAVQSVRDTLGYLGNFAKIATKEFLFLAVGVVIAIGLFLNPALDTDLRNQRGSETTLYSLYFNLIAERFRSLYRSFETVMGAQLLISAINTVLTAVFVFGASLRYAGVIVGITFVCGLLPIIGNLISNALIVGIAFTKSPQMAGWALVFLIAVHKLEYFLNSKIVGSRIRHPMWLTLLALILGERLMGIPGIILAPVVLNFVKVEASRYKAVDGSAIERVMDVAPLNELAAESKLGPALKAQVK
jgi:predicted PurR-regulated permease PerM